MNPTLHATNKLLTNHYQLIDKIEFKLKHHSNTWATKTRYTATRISHICCVKLSISSLYNYNIPFGLALE